MRDEDWIAGETVTHFLTAQCNQAGFTPRILHHSSEYRVMITLASLGHGISYMPIVDELIPLLPAVALRKLDIARQLQDVLLICRHTSRARPAVNAVRTLMLQRARQI